MSKTEIKELFEKIQLFFTLDCIEILLPYTNDESINEIFNIVYKEKYEQKYEQYCFEFEGRNEYTDMIRVSIFDISEINKNIDKFSQKELLFIRNIINNVLLHANENELTNKLISKLIEYKDIGTDNYIEEKKTENFFNKYDINELDLLYSILNYNHEPYVTKYKEILNRVRKEKKDTINISSDCSLLNKYDKLNNEELRFLYKLVSDASSYLSSVQDYSDTYKQIIDDFDIDEYPVKEMYKLEESLSNELENRKRKNKQYTYNK